MKYVVRVTPSVVFLLESRVNHTPASLIASPAKCGSDRKRPFLLSVRSWRCILCARRISPWPDAALETD